MHIVRKGARPLIDLCVAFAIGFFLVLLNYSISYVDRIHGFLEAYSDFFATDWLVNFLFFWLAVLLWLAFRRWRAAARRSVELENVISSISPDTLLVVKPDRIIEMCNASVKRTFGYTPEEVAGQKTELLYMDRRRDKDFHPREVYEALKRDGFHIGRATGRRKNGEQFPLEIIAGDLSGRTGAVLLLRDVTERIEAEKRRQELESRIRQRQKLESLGVLAGGIAHDFNNLLTVILGNSELVLMEAPPDSRTYASVQSIVSAGKQAAGLCNQMLAYSGKGKFVIQTLNLSDVVKDTVQMLEVSIRDQVTLNFDLADDLPPVEGDIVQIQQVIMNLVINAGDALGKNGCIDVQTGKRHCNREFLAGCPIDAKLAEGDYVYLQVTDNGCGMSEETRSKIFDPFFTTKTSGRGLGLASVFGIMRGHHGALRVESKEGEGSTFTALFPCERE